MAATGHDFTDAWAYAIKTGAAGDWDGWASADDDIQLSDAIDLDKKSACVVGVTIDEPDNDAVAANSVTVAVLQDAGDAYENTPALAGAGIGRPQQFVVTPVQDSNVYVEFEIDPKSGPAPKICVMNESGANLVTTVQYKTATVPVAS